MTHNDVLRRLRYAFDFGDSKMIELFDLGGEKVSRAQVSDWLKRDDDPDFQACSGAQLAAFLNGLVTDRRGRREGAPPAADTDIDNNGVLVKLKIAQSLQADGMMAIMQRGGHTLSKHELSAFFRKPGHKHYRECKDQVLRKFLRGLQLELRGESTDADVE